MWRKYQSRLLLVISSQAFAQLEFRISQRSKSNSLLCPSSVRRSWLAGSTSYLDDRCEFILSTLPPWYLVDRWGRRPILLSGAVVMVFALCATGYFMYLGYSWTPNAVVASVIVFNAAFGYSWGPLPWLCPPEIVPLTFLAKGVSLFTATNWAFNWIVGQMTPYLQEVITWLLYFMHGFFLRL